MNMAKRAYYNENIRCYSDGRIERLFKRTNRFGKAGTWKEVKQTNFTRGGYLRIGINGKIMLWHRVIWIAFNGAIPNGLEINHKDEDKSNNSLDNLELVTHVENMNHGTRNKRASRAQSKPVIGINIETGKMIEFASINEAGRNGFNQGNICNCIKGKYKYHKGYRWYYKNQKGDEQRNVNQ